MVCDGGACWKGGKSGEGRAADVMPKAERGLSNGELEFNIASSRAKTCRRGSKKL